MRRPKPSNDLSFFHAYDLRGRFPEELGPREAQRLGEVLASKWAGPFLIGRDPRTASRALSDVLVASLRRSGRAVHELGIAPTPALEYWAKLAHHPALSVSPSHNPVGYAGIKGFDRRGRLLGKEWENVREAWRTPVLSSPKDKPAPCLHPSPVSGWKSAYVRHVSRGLKGRGRIVLDLRGGASVELAPRALRGIAMDVVTLHAKPSPTFAGVGPEPDGPSVRALGRHVLREAADLGATFDGDGDRVVFVDDRGRAVAAEAIGLLLHRRWRKGRAPLVASADAARRLRSLTDVRYSPIGSRFVTSRMKMCKASVGFEPSGHYYTRGHGEGSDGIWVACLLADQLRRETRPLSSTIEEFGAFARWAGTFKLDSPQSGATTLRRILAALQIPSVARWGGFEVRFPEGWGFFRLSNTQLAVRITLEGETGDGLIHLKRRLADLGLSGLAH